MPGWPVLAAWAHDLVTAVAAEQPTEHVAVFLPDRVAGGLRLAAQVWGAAEDTGDVRVGSWLVPFEGSVCGRVYRTGSAALVSDITMDPDYRTWPGSRSRSSLTVPILKAGVILGVVNVEAPWIAAFSIRDYERLVERAAEAAASVPRIDGEALAAV